ncbi:MAG TPA: purine-nucleoside phosphorylase [Candidatus Wallbacteria bacterium]|nr:purine-nucleoside phosphorylase [Candidatus Wallbacteria bacterium]
MEKELYLKIEETVKFIKSKTALEPDVAVILGTGLGHLASAVHDRVEITYDQIPHFVTSTVESHAGKLILGKMHGHTVVMMQGRFHYYEGYDLAQITYPVRVMHALGAKIMMVSNAAGGLHPNFAAGDLMIIRDHINLQGVNPLVGRNDPRLGPRFPDMCEPYDRALIKIFEETALDLKMRIQKGVYAALTGPCLETPAEYKFLRIIGSDAVGMSTVPEVIVAKHEGMRVFGLSIITDLANNEVIEPVDLARIIKTANAASLKLTQLFNEVMKKTKL